MVKWIAGREVWSWRRALFQQIRCVKVKVVAVDRRPEPAKDCWGILGCWVERISRYSGTDATVRNVWTSVERRKLEVGRRRKRLGKLRRVLFYMTGGNLEETLWERMGALGDICNEHTLIGSESFRAKQSMNEPKIRQKKFAQLG